MNMIYVVMFCYLSNGNCFIPNGHAQLIYFNTLEQCEHQASISNNNTFKDPKTDLHAACFTKQGWTPVQKISQEEVSPSKDIQTLVNELAVGCAISNNPRTEVFCKRAFALRKTPLTPDELMCIHKFANAAREEAYDAAKYSIDSIFMVAAVSGKCAAR